MIFKRINNGVLSFIYIYFVIKTSRYIVSDTWIDHALIAYLYNSKQCDNTYTKNNEEDEDQYLNFLLPFGYDLEKS